MTLTGLCDLHCHYLPCIDDGVRSTDDGRALCVGLRSLGYETVVATPHIRAGMFDNNKAELSEVYACFVAAVAGDEAMPATGLAAEHFCDDIFFELLEQGNALPYPGGHAVLVEFPPERLPLRVGEQFFRMQVRGLRPVIAHPERYTPLWKDIEPLESLVDRGALALLDVMSLSGKYGRRSMRTAEELLEAGLYYAACTDSHKPEDLEIVQRSLERLVELLGLDGAQLLLGERPRSILDGTVEGLMMQDNGDQAMLAVDAMPADASAERSMVARVLPKFLISLALGGLFAWIAARGGIPLLPPRAAFAHVQPWAVPAYLASLIVLHYFRASRWRFLIAPIKKVPLGEVLLLNWIGFFAIFILPLRLGELARPALTKLRQAVPISAGFGTVAVERVLDGLLTSLCVAFTLLALPRLDTQDPVARHLPAYGYAALGLFACAFIALGMFLWQRAFAVRVTRWTAGLVSPRLGQLLAEKVGNVADGIRSIGSPRLAAGFLLESVAYWSVNACGVWLLGRGVGLPLSLGHAFAVMGVLAIGILLPTGPGLFGNFQLAVFACLKLFFPESIVASEGAVFVFLLYVLQSSVMIVAGMVPLYALRLRMSDLLRVSVAPEPDPTRR